MLGLVINDVCIVLVYVYVYELIYSIRFVTYCTVTYVYIPVSYLPVAVI